MAKNCFGKIVLFVLLLTLAGKFSAQSTNQLFPTPIVSGEINGRIKARDIGDSRLTQYFYTFFANNGDVFINVESNNLDGDIDIFTFGDLRPLTKIPLYAGNESSQTGRVVYFRERKQLILRIEGRTPTDGPATFSIKFAGSFEAMPGTKLAENSSEPILKDKTEPSEAEVRVNSVGAVIEYLPKKQPEKPVEIAKVETPKKPSSSTKPTKKPKPKKEVVAKEKPIEPETPVEIVAETPKIETTPKEVAKKPTKTPKKPKKPVKPEVLPTEVAIEKTEPVEKTVTEVAKVETPKPVKKPKQPKKPKVVPPENKTPQPDPLASIHLIVLLKDGTKFESPMDEILRVNVDKGVMTIITKDGRIERFSLVDVLKTTIE